MHTLAHHSRNTAWIILILAALILGTSSLSAAQKGSFFSRIFRKTPEVELTHTLKKARKDKAWPGAVLLAGTKDSVLFVIPEGYETYSEKNKVRSDAMFDMASITKVISTTSAVMKLYDEGKINLDAKVQEFIPQFTGPDSQSTEWKKDITIRNLLTHTAGLPPFRPFWKYPGGIEGRLDSVYATALDTAPGVRYVYSDISMILMAKIVEKIAGEPIDVFNQKNIFGPLGMTSTCFNPDSSEFYRIMPTEYSVLEKGFIRGHVHDENAYGFGGVAGHAGLFSTVEDLGKYSRMMLRNGVMDNGERLYSSAVIDTFRHRANIIPNNSRCLGWDSPGGPASGGVYISNNSIGHTGFTGTSLWIDYDNGLYVILLTNAVHPDRKYKSPNYFDWRQKVHSTVYEVLGLDKRNPDLQWRRRWR